VTWPEALVKVVGHVTELAVALGILYFGYRMFKDN
jgi:hypothetical protein